MQKKTNDLQDAVKKNPPDIKLLQLVLQGSISVQVYNCVWEYTNKLIPTAFWFHYCIVCYIICSF